MRVLVTGGAGYMERMSSARSNVWPLVAVLDDLSSGSRDRLSPDTPFFSVLSSTLRSSSRPCTATVRKALSISQRRRPSKNPSIDLWLLPRERHRYALPVDGHGRAGVRRILFSSSAAVYGVPTDGLVTEKSQLSWDFSVTKPSVGTPYTAALDENRICRTPVSTMAVNRQCIPMTFSRS